MPSHFTGITGTQPHEWKLWAQDNRKAILDFYEKNRSELNVRNNEDKLEIGQAWIFDTSHQTPRMHPSSKVSGILIPLSLDGGRLNYTWVNVSSTGGIGHTYVTGCSSIGWNNWYKMKVPLPDYSHLVRFINWTEDPLEEVKE